MARKRSTSGGLFDRLRGIYQRASQAEVVDERVEAAKPKPRYKLSAKYTRPTTPPVECPAGVPASEWAEAQRNVAFGSAPSTIAAGSDIPSDFTMRRMGLASS